VLCFWWCPCCSSLYISPKNIAQKYIKMSNMDITSKHTTEIYKDEQHGSMLFIFIYFCAMFFGDVGNVAHLYIFLWHVCWWCPCCSSLYISVLCFLVMSMLKMSYMDITKKHSTEIYKDELHGHHQQI
jgi:hypothetical protein